ncbi:MAG: ArsA-related P-loop ATPase [Myxococcota bacterium]|nr:ArsA-related P-loop ATPase [Myxococcota bacterium]
MSPIEEVIDQKKIAVCCGAGGVGKTTVAASLALEAARRGRRVLVLTIDPSRRLAETLGVSQNTPDPVELSPALQELAGIKPPGSLAAWILNPERVSDRTVKRLVPDPKKARKLMDQPIYRSLVSMTVGMQEYTAMEALHQFVEQGRFDFIVLDTPPSRNALNFLEAPVRLGRFFDSRVFSLFLPRKDGAVIGTTRKVIDKVFGGIFGVEFYHDLQDFFRNFAEVFLQLSENAKAIRQRLECEDCCFLLVASPTAERVEDAVYLKHRIDALNLNLGGFILNRSLIPLADRSLPGPDLLPSTPTDAQRSALAKLQELATIERTRLEEHRQILEQLAEEAGDSSMALAVPELGDTVDDIQGLGLVAQSLIEASESVAQRR